MRLHLKLSANTESVPFNYQVSLVGAFHKWIGVNEIHDEVSFYSLSWLKGGKKVKNGLTFNGGAAWHISSPDNEIVKKVINGIRQFPELNFGMQVEEIQVQETPKFASEEYFFVDSPVLIKRSAQQEKEVHFLYDNPNSDALLTETLNNKLDKYGKGNLHVKVAFDRNYALAKTKLARYRNIGNKCSICPVIIKGDPEAIAFAWNVGIGNSTGIGFGALK